MKASAIFLVIASVFVVNASVIHDGNALLKRHAHFGRGTTVARSPMTRRCRPRPNNGNNTGNQGSPPAADPGASDPAPPPPPPPQNDPPAQGGGNNHPNSGVINVPSDCGPIGATEQITDVSGPNGSLDWLNCGVESGGWNPPYIAIGDLKFVDLWDSVNSGNSPFSACSAFLGLFQQYGDQFGLPPILIASIAMQESSCNPGTVGGGGEQGLMQITQDKCGGAPGGNCQDPDFNVRTGAKFFADTLAANNGNVLLTIGQYNGWRTGLTVGEATAAQYSDCCLCQQNLDYPMQFLNYWLQGEDPYSARAGKYHNLEVCR